MTPLSRVFQVGAAVVLMVSGVANASDKVTILNTDGIPEVELSTFIKARMRNQAFHGGETPRITGESSVGDGAYKGEAREKTTLFYRQGGVQANAEFTVGYDERPGASRRKYSVLDGVTIKKQPRPGKEKEGFTLEGKLESPVLGRKAAPRTAEATGLPLVTVPVPADMPMPNPLAYVGEPVSVENRQVKVPMRKGQLKQEAGEGAVTREVRWNLHAKWGWKTMPFVEEIAFPAPAFLSPRRRGSLRVALADGTRDTIDRIPGRDTIAFAGGGTATVTGRNLTKSAKTQAADMLASLGLSIQPRQIPNNFEATVRIAPTPPRDRTVEVKPRGARDKALRIPNPGGRPPTNRAGRE